MGSGLREGGEWPYMSADKGPRGPRSSLKLSISWDWPEMEGTCTRFLKLDDLY